jgi:hypothetical protein
MLSIDYRQHELQIRPSSFSLRRGEGIITILRAKAMRRVNSHQLAVKLTWDDLRQLVALLHEMMKDGGEGKLRTSFIAKTPYTTVKKKTLKRILTSKKLPPTIYELLIRFEDDRRSIEVNLSRTGAITRVIGGAFDEYWEEDKQTRLTKFMRGRKAKFLPLLFSLGPLLAVGGIYTLAGWPSGNSHRPLSFYYTYIATSFISAGLVWLHQKGIFFPHARIVLRKDDSKNSDNAVLVIGFLSLVAQIVGTVREFFRSVLSPYERLLRGLIYGKAKEAGGSLLA